MGEIYWGNWWMERGEWGTTTNVFREELIRCVTGERADCRWSVLDFGHETLVAHMLLVQIW